MPDQESYEVVIVGGGLVGLSLAASLKGSRLSTLLIDAGDAPVSSEPAPAAINGASLASGVNPRVSTVSTASKEFLSRIGGWPETGERICAFTGMRVWDARGTASISFDASDTGEPQLGFVLENASILVSLNEASAANPDLEIRWQTRIESITQSSGAGFVITLTSGEKIGCDLLVGADGGNSIVREACGLRALKWDYGQDALVTTIQTELAHENIARQCFTAEGPLAFLPLSEEKLCSIVWSSKIKDELLGLDDAGFCERLTSASESVLGNVAATDKRFAFPLRQQHVLRYTRPHLALIGDAAHTIHPLAGQGANLGFADAEALSMLLKDCRFSGQSPGDASLLRRYQLMRQPSNAVMTLAMEGFKRLYEPDTPFVNWLRNTGTRFVDNSPALKSMVVRVASGRSTSSTSDRKQ